MKTHSVHAASAHNKCSAFSKTDSSLRAQGMERMATGVALSR